MVSGPRDYIKDGL